MSSSPGHHAAFKARVQPGTTVTVIGDGAVGPSAVLAAKRLGAERIIMMGRHTARTGQTVSREQTPEGYRAMAAREALKVIVRP